MNRIRPPPDRPKCKRGRKRRKISRLGITWYRASARRIKIEIQHPKLQLSDFIDRIFDKIKYKLSTLAILNIFF